MDILRLKLVDLGALCHWTPRSDERRFSRNFEGIASSAVDRSFGYASEDTVRRGSSAQDCASPTIGMRLLESNASSRVSGNKNWKAGPESVVVAVSHLHLLLLFRKSVATRKSIFIH